MSARTCAIGRTIAREDQAGDLNWTTSCARAPGNHAVRVPGLGDFDLCPEHAAVLLPLLAEARRQRLARTGEDPEQYCAVGRSLTVDSTIPRQLNWTDPCHADPTMTVRMNNGQTYRLCRPHGTVTQHAQQSERAHAN